MVKNYTKNVIRLRKGKPGVSQVYWIIVILNKKKTSSQKIVERLGFYRHGSKKIFSISYERLAYYLNKGVKIKKSILKYIYWHTKLYNNLLKKSVLQLKKKKIKKW